jgi:hypothetical protein
MNKGSPARIPYTPDASLRPDRMRQSGAPAICPGNRSAKRPASFHKVSSQFPG